MSDINKINKLYKQGKSITEISNILQKGCSTIYYHLKKNKIQFQSMCENCDTIINGMQTKRFCSKNCKDKKYYHNGYRNKNNKKKCKNNYKKLRNKVINIYGGICVYCGISDERILTLDHVNNDGNSDRKIRGAWAIYKDACENINSGKFQLLCRNCNWIKMLEYKEGGAF